MTLAENTRERSLCGKDLNRLETSFVETPINVSLSFITSKDQLNTNILILSVSALCYLWNSQKKSFIFIYFKTHSALKPFLTYLSFWNFSEFRSHVTLHAETADSASMSSQFDMEQQKKQVKQVRDATIFRKRRSKKTGLDILVRDN